jgi:hypothetical protein
MVFLSLGRILATFCSLEDIVAIESLGEEIVKFCGTVKCACGFSPLF